MPWDLTLCPLLSPWQVIASLLWLQAGPCYLCESGQKVFVGKQVVTSNMCQQKYTGGNTGCKLCKNLRHSTAFIDSFWSLCVSGRHQCFFSLASDMLLKRCLSWLVAAYRCNALQASQPLCFIFSLTLTSSNITDGLQDLLRQARKLPELNIYLLQDQKLYSYSVTSVADAVSVVANRGLKKLDSVFLFLY